ncbi:MAG TPA: M17 family peptidase N-terminal domain-containing protein, partial [Enhygromyxa sp.]|nr:M17 family peptidase N-terminal domain-containing protein [Enhygromyxa sp.]
TRVELGIVPVFGDERPLLGLAGLLDWRGSGRLSAILRSGFFTGATNEQLLTIGERRWPIDRLVLVGLGPRAEFDEPAARRLGSRCVEIATGLASDAVLIALPTGPIDRGLVELAFDSLLGAIERASIAHAREEAAAIEVPSGEGADREDAPSEHPEEPALQSQAPVEREEPRWWVVADEAVVARLRRVRSGPPKAARGGPSLYT